MSRAEELARRIGHNVAGTLRFVDVPAITAIVESYGELCIEAAAKVALDNISGQAPVIANNIKRMPLP